MGESRRAELLETAREEYIKEVERRVRIAIDGIVSQGKVSSFYSVG